MLARRLAGLMVIACALSDASIARAVDVAKPDVVPPQKAAEKQLSDGRLAYERGDYAVAVQTLVPLLYPSIELSTEDAVIEAHRLLALSYILQKKEAEAEEEATSLFALRPGFQLDPIVDPPTAVIFFETVRRRQGDRLRDARERERRDAEAHARAADERRRATVRTERRSRVVATIPFGVGQWQNGQPRKAAAFLSTELVFGAASLAGFLTIEQKYPHRFYTASEQGTVQGLLGLQLGAGIAFWATLLWGVIDAHVLFKHPDKRQEPSVLRSLVPAATVSPGQVGLGLQGAF